MMSVMYCKQQEAGYVTLSCMLVHVGEHRQQLLAAILPIYSTGFAVAHLHDTLYLTAADRAHAVEFYYLPDD